MTLIRVRWEPGQTLAGETAVPSDQLSEAVVKIKAAVGPDHENDIRIQFIEMDTFDELIDNLKVLCDELSGGNIRH